MKLSLAWLHELVDVSADAQELSDRLSDAGLAVASPAEFRLRFPGVRIARVLESGPHPNADRLSLCRVTTGTEEVPVVCGAPNVRAGLTVAMALPGAVLPGDVKIKKAKIRGEISMGMICSERELGLGPGQEGILELPGDLEVGRPLDDHLGYEDTVLELEVTRSRPDLLSHLGVAREIAALYGTEVRWPDAGDEVEVADEDRGWTVRILDGIGCRRFTARLVDGLTVGPAPVWMRQRLLATGQQPINAVVDASHYVLKEVGQPTHVFDRSQLHGSQILLRPAGPDEPLTTLDGTARLLSPEQLVVADAEGPIALAGILGGERSAVNAATTDVLLGIAHFDPETIGRGRRLASVNTVTSDRFERGVDDERLPWVSRRLGYLLQQVAGGAASPRRIEVVGKPLAARARFFVRTSQVRRMVGADVPPPEMAAMLRRLSIPARADTEGGRDGVWVEPPSFRRDLVEEIDAIGEIARLRGIRLRT